MKTAWIAISVATLILAAGCKNADTTTSNTTPTTTSPPPIDTTTAPQATALTTPAATAYPTDTLSANDKDFITKAAEGGQLEVALGKEVSQQGNSPVVKTFGQRMVADHSKANDELSKLAASKGVTLPTTLDDEHEKTLDKMSKLSGEKLDKAYANDMVDDHEEDIKEFRRASKNLGDPDVRAWAAKTLPVLEEHLTMAKDMKAKTK